MELSSHVGAETLVKQARINIPAHGFFLCVAPVICFLMVWLTPPFQVADEYAHFARSYQVSGGQWYGVKFDQRVGGLIPVSLLRTAGAFENMPFQPQQKLNRSLWRQSWSVSLCPEKLFAIDFAGAGFMPPYAYLPQAGAMRIGTLLHSPPILLLYLGRLANASLWCLCVYLAVRLIPTASWLLTTLALAPMSVFQAASLSYDASINGLAFLFLALILRRALATDCCVRWKDFLIWMLLIVTIAVSKPFYVVLVLLVLIVPPPRSAKRFYYAKMALFIAGIIVLCLSLWTKAASNYLTYADYNPAFRDTQALMPGANPSLQAQYILSHPVVSLRAIAMGLLNRHRCTEWIGKLGWLDTPLPVWFYVGFGLLVLFLVATDCMPGVRINLWQRVGLAVIAFLTFMAVAASLYLIFSPVGAHSVCGLQGRYLIPIMPMLLIALHGNIIRIFPAGLARLVPIILVMVQVMTVMAVLRRYYF